MTDWVGRISEMVQNRPAGPAVIGAGVFPTEAMKLDQELDVRIWVKEGLGDFVVPFVYVDRTRHVTIDLNSTW